MRNSVVCTDISVSFTVVVAVVGTTTHCYELSIYFWIDDCVIV